MSFDAVHRTRANSYGGFGSGFDPYAAALGQAGRYSEAQRGVLGEASHKAMDNVVQTTLRRVPVRIIDELANAHKPTFDNVRDSFVSSNARNTIAAQGQTLMMSAPTSSQTMAALSNITKNTVTWREILGMGNMQSKAGESAFRSVVENLQANGQKLTLANSAGRSAFMSAWKDSVRYNFKDFLKPNQYTQSMTAGSFFKNTVVAGNIRAFVEPFQTKRWPMLIPPTLSWGFLGWGVFKSTRDAYRNAKDKEDGSFGSKLNTWWQTGKTLVTKLAKSLLLWEVANIGYTFGFALFTMATTATTAATAAVTGLSPLLISMAPIAAGIIGAGVLAAGANVLLNKVIPDPPEHGKTKTAH